MEQLMLKRTCPICDCDTGRRILDVEFVNEDNNPLPNRYRIVICEECGFSFADMDCSQKIFDKYYSECNVYQEAISLRKREREDWQYIADFIKQHGSIESSVLDVGCGGGELLERLKQEGIGNICGLDPSPESIERLRTKQINGICSNIFDEIKTEHFQTFDFVVSTAVIEHIFDLNIYIEQMKKYLKKDGYLIILVPNVDGFRNCPLPLAHYFNQEHINYFGADSLDNLLKTHGMRRIKDALCLGEEKALLCIYKKEQVKQVIKKDMHSGKAILDYLRIVENTESKYDKIINDVMASGRQIVIFGTGAFAKRILSAYMKKLENKIIFFCDNNQAKYGQTLCGKKIVSAKELKEIGEDVIILICSMKNGEDIRSQIFDMNIKNELVVL